MTAVADHRHNYQHTYFRGAVEHILSLQQADGSIPWLVGGVIDPWNHTEAAMALSVAGQWEAAERAYAFLAESQLADGSWWGEYGNAVPMKDRTHLGNEGAPRLRDSNFSAYIATGIWHHYMTTGEKNFLRHYWPTVRNALDFVVGLQSPHGDIAWCAEATGVDGSADALISGCSSIYKSLQCGCLIAETIGEEASLWSFARQRLGLALREKPHRFDRSWETKARFSMDWYYPVLTGVYDGGAAQARLDKKWDVFVVDGLGCRCVSDEPWVTVAESCELVMALLATRQRQRAEELFSWQSRLRDDDGTYWMGYQYAEKIMWPEEKPAWTSAAVILAADALFELTNAAKVLTGTT